jgi:hypothetical protein
MGVLEGWPTDGAEGAVSTEARWRAMARLWAPSGVVSGQGGELAPVLGAGVIDVAAGAAWVDGHYCELGSAASEPVTANGLLVIRFTPADNLFELVFRDGITTPTQSDAIWELPIARVTAGVMVDLRRIIAVGGAGIERVGHVRLTAGGPISFTDIPQNLSHLRLVASLRAEAASTAVVCFMRVNGDANTLYDHQTNRGTGTSNSAAHTSSDTGFRFAVPGASAQAAQWSPLVAEFPDYRGASHRKNAIWTYGWNSSSTTGATAGDIKVETAFGHIRQIAAIASLVLAPSSGQWAAGSVASLYGLL